MNESHVTVCRLCMGHGEGMLPISPGEANYTKLILVFQLKLLKRAGMPSHICYVCLDRLDAAHRFRQQILNVGKTLQAMYGKVCITKAKSKLFDSLSREEVDLENGEVPISFAEMDTKGKEVPASLNLEVSEIINLETGSTTTKNNQEVAVNEEVDPIAIDNEDTACLLNSIIKEEDCTTANYSDTSFVYVSTEMDYVSIVDHIDTPSFEEILQTKKQQELHDAKEASKINKSEFEVSKNYRCLICGKEYWSVKPFTSHMETQHGGNQLVNDSIDASTIGLDYRCKFCRAAFGTQKQLKVHCCPSQKPKQLFTGHVKCSRCGKLFSVLKDLNDHITQSHMYKCNICDRRYYAESGLATHMKQKHRNKNKGRPTNVTTNEGETEKRKRLNEETDPIIGLPQLQIVTPISISSTMAEPMVNIKAEDLAKAPHNQQHLKITDDLPFNGNHVLVKEEVDLGTETVGALAIPSYNDDQVNSHHFIQASQTMDVNISENDSAMWQTGLPLKVELFFDGPTLGKEGQESEDFDETSSMSATDQNEKWCCSCLICNTSFQYFSQFIAHMTNHDASEIKSRSKSERVPCTVCKKSFLNTKSYKRHLIGAKCPKTKVSAKQVAAQARKAKEEAAKEAARMTAAIKSAAQYRKSNAMWKAFSRNSVKCTTCSKTFTSTIELEAHLRKHKYIKRDNEEFSCIHCDKVFYYKLRLANHINKHHFISVDT